MRTRILFLFGLAMLLTACGPTSPTQPPARVAFASTQDGITEIYVMDADGSNRTRLTNTSKPTVQNDLVWNFSPSWSPDGSKIVFCNFTGDIEGKFETSMNMMDADGSNLIRSSTDSASVFECRPAWSSNSAKVAFTSLRDGNVEIYVMDADGANKTRLTDNPADDADPQWSPDGSKIVFSSLRKAITRTPNRACEQCERIGEPFTQNWSQIYVVNVDGSNEVRLSTNTTDLFDDSSPAWSPDGRKIAFLSDRDGTYSHQIYVMDADGSHETPLLNHPGGVGCFEWTPDGSKIAFSSQEGTHLMNADRSGDTLLNPHVSECWADIAWSPDGGNIANIVLTDGVEIYRMDPDGSNYINLTETPDIEEYFPAWSPGLVPPMQPQ